MTDTQEKIRRLVSVDLIVLILFCMGVKRLMDAPRNNYILVAGGCGFLGSNFVRNVAQNHSDIQIVVLDSLTYAGSASNLPYSFPNVDLMVGDICDPQTVDGLVLFADAVVNFAAETHNDNSINEPTPFLYTNVEGTFNLIEACRKYDIRYHHVSTDEVFGDLSIQGLEQFNESSPYRPSSPYSATKAASDLLVKAWVRTYGLRATISNSSNCYGPYQYTEKFIPNVITSVLRGVKPKLYGNGRNVREWMYAEDHSSAIWKILTEGHIGESYTISSSNSRSNIEVLQLILKLMGKSEDYFERVADRPGHDRRYSLDSSKLRHELGWEPRHTDFVAGLQQTIDWYRNNEAWWRD